MFMQNFIKLSAAVHELSCPQAFVPYLTIVKNPKIRSLDLDLWSWNSQISRFTVVVKEHVHRAQCSS